LGGCLSIRPTPRPWASAGVRQSFRLTIGAPKLIDCSSYTAG